MTISELIADLILRYMLLGAYWQLFTYAITLIFSIILVFWGKRSKITISNCLILILLCLYLSTVYVSAVLARRQMLFPLVSLTPLISWRRALSGDRYGIQMVIENIIMLMPMGFLLPFVFKSKYYVIKTVMSGFLFSLFVESSQYVKKTGLFEVDDLINNTLGVIAGCGLATIIIAIRKRIKADR